jgi:4-guanidinobutyraldehyde dehydrogenase / NAD-dependent aldehyde dehydrogenase
MATTTETTDLFDSSLQSAKRQTQAFINGQFSPAVDGQTFECLSPGNGKRIDTIASCGPLDIDRAVESASAAFKKGSWRDAAPKERKKKLLALAEKIQQHSAELAVLETIDMGKPISDSSRVDMPLVSECFAWFAEAVDKVYDEVAPVGKGSIAFVTREPVGVVGSVIPWNYPLLMAAWKVAPALATGNSVVLKPAEQSPLTALRLAELAAEVGIPEGVFNVVPGFGETAGKALGLHPKVDCLAFTGSTEVGKYFMQYSGQSNLKSVWLECGGKSPQIIMPDCDIDSAARGAAFGIFYNQGEVCNAGSRLLVHESIKDEFLEKVRGWSLKMQPGDPLNPKTRMGAMVDQRQMERVLDYINKGQSEGAKLVQGGKRVLSETGGFYIEPTIFDEVKNSMVIAQEEIFGPVLSVLTFASFEQAIEIANDSQYGLAASIWTKDLSTAHKAARELAAGTVWVNSYDLSDMTVPFGGFKQSGFGRDKSLHAFDKYTNLKTTWIKL